MARVIIKHALRKHKEFIINANKKRSEYVSYKEETVQMQKLGIADNA